MWFHDKAETGRELCLGLTRLTKTLMHPLKSALTKTYPQEDVEDAPPTAPSANCDVFSSSFSLW